MASVDTVSYFDTLHSWLDFQVGCFHEQGYQAVTSEELWLYFQDFLWKRGVPPRYYDQVVAILDVTPNQYFDFVAMTVQKQSQSTLDQIDLDALF